MDIRAIRETARRGLHDTFSVPANYYPPGSNRATLLYVRVSDHRKAFGDMVGFDYQPAERLADAPEVIALTENGPFDRGGVFAISDTEVYSIETVYPPDDITTTLQVSRLDEDEIEVGAYTPPAV